MGFSSEFQCKVRDVTFDVKYTFSGFGADCDLDESEIFVGGQEISEVLSDKVMCAIETRIYEDAAKNRQEPDDADRDDPRLDR